MYVQKKISHVKMSKLLFYFIDIEQCRIVQYLLLQVPPQYSFHICNANITVLLSIQAELNVSIKNEHALKKTSI